MKVEEMQLGRREGPSMLPIVIGAIVLPLSTFIWFINTFIPIFGRPDSSDPLTPGRCLLALTLPLVIAVYGIRKKSLSLSGALLALFVGFFVTMSSYCFVISLLVFFFTGSRATKFRQYQKKKMEQDFKEGGQRNWIQVICNGGMATHLAILYLMDIGYGEKPVDFVKSYRASWLGMGILGSLACANGDTWASELGSVISTTVPRLITSFKKVPPGTNGGVTLGGLVFSLLGGVAVGIGYYLALIFTVDSAILARSPPQWPIIVFGGIGGLLGSAIDSLLGATLQFSGKGKDNKIHEIPGPDVTPISGVCLFDNHSINLLSTILTGLILPVIAKISWNLVA